MPPKKTKKATKPKKGKGKNTKTSQVQTTRVNVRVAGGPGGPGGGGGAGGGSGGGAYLNIPKGMGLPMRLHRSHRWDMARKSRKLRACRQHTNPRRLRENLTTIFPRGFRTSPPGLLDLNPTAI